MKQYRSSTNNSDDILSVSFSVPSPFELRSTSVRESKIDRRIIEERTENHRRQDGDVSKL